MENEPPVEINDFSTVTPFEKCVRAVELHLRQWGQGQGFSSPTPSSPLSSPAGARVVAEAEIAVDDSSPSAASFVLSFAAAADRRWGGDGGGGGASSSALVVAAEQPGTPATPTSPNPLWEMGCPANDFVGGGGGSGNPEHLFFGFSTYATLRPTAVCGPETRSQALSILTLAAANAQFCHPCFARDETDDELSQSSPSATFALPGGTYWGYAAVGADGGGGRPFVLRCKTAERSPAPKQLHALHGVTELLEGGLGLKPSLAGEGLSASARRTWRRGALTRREWSCLDSFLNPAELKWGAAADPVRSLEVSLRWPARRVDDGYYDAFGDDAAAAVAVRVRLAPEGGAAGDEEEDDDESCRLTAAARVLVALHRAARSGCGEAEAGAEELPAQRVRADCHTIFRNAARETDTGGLSAGEEEDEEDEEEGSAGGEPPAASSHTFFHRVAYYYCTTQWRVRAHETARGAFVQHCQAAWSECHAGAAAPVASSAVIPFDDRAVLEGCVSLLEKKVQLLACCIADTQRRQQQQAGAAAAADEAGVNGGDDPLGVAWRGDGFNVPVTKGMLRSLSGPALATNSDSVVSDMRAFKAANPGGGASLARFVRWHAEGCGDEEDEEDEALQRLWRAAKPLPALPQCTEAEVAGFAEAALRWLDSLPLHGFVEALFAHFLAHAAGLLLAAARHASRIAHVRALLAAFRADVAARGGRAAAHDELCRRLRGVECCALAAESLVERFAHPDAAEVPAGALPQILDVVGRAVEAAGRRRETALTAAEWELVKPAMVGTASNPDGSEYILRCSSDLPLSIGMAVAACVYCCIFHPPPPPLADRSEACADDATFHRVYVSVSDGMCVPLVSPTIPFSHTGTARVCTAVREVVSAFLHP